MIRVCCSWCNRQATHSEASESVSYEGETVERVDYFCDEHAEERRAGHDEAEDGELTLVRL